MGILDRFTLHITDNADGTAHLSRGGIDDGGSKITITKITTDYVVIRIGGGAYWSGRGQRGYGAARIIVAAIEGIAFAKSEIVLTVAVRGEDEVRAQALTHEAIHTRIASIKTRRDADVAMAKEAGARAAKGFNTPAMARAVAAVDAMPIPPADETAEAVTEVRHQGRLSIAVARGGRSKPDDPECVQLTLTSSERLVEADATLSLVEFARALHQGYEVPVSYWVAHAPPPR